MPLEMLEYVLIKAYVLNLWEISTLDMQKSSKYWVQLLKALQRKKTEQKTSIYWVQLSKVLQRKKAEPFVILSSVSTVWWQTLVGWPQPDPESRAGLWVRHQIQKRLNGESFKLLINSRLFYCFIMLQ